MRYESMPPLRDAKRVLEFCSASENLPPRLERKIDRLRCVASRAALRNLAPSSNAHDAIVSANMDQPIVNQKIVSDGREPLCSIIIRVRNRLIRNVAAGEDDR